MVFLAAPTLLVAKLSKRISKIKFREVAETKKFHPSVAVTDPYFRNFRLTKVSGLGHATSKCGNRPSSVLHNVNLLLLHLSYGETPLVF